MSDNGLFSRHLGELVVGDDVVDFDDVRDLPFVDDLSCFEIHSKDGMRVELTHEKHGGVLVVKHDLCASRRERSQLEFEREEDTTRN